MIGMYLSFFLVALDRTSFRPPFRKPLTSLTLSKISAGMAVLTCWELHVYFPFQAKYAAFTARDGCSSVPLPSSRPAQLCVAPLRGHRHREHDDDTPTYPIPKWPIYTSFFGIPVGVASIVGPTLGGAITV